MIRYFTDLMNRICSFVICCCWHTACSSVVMHVCCVSWQVILNWRRKLQMYVLQSISSRTKFYIPVRSVVTTPAARVLFPRYLELVCWKPDSCAHRVWRNSSFYQEVQRSLSDYRDGGFPWTMRLHKILFQVRENCYRMSWNVEDSFWGTSYGPFPNISVVFPV